MTKRMSARDESQLHLSVYFMKQCTYSHRTDYLAFAEVFLDRDILISIQLITHQCRLIVCSSLVQCLQQPSESLRHTYCSIVTLHCISPVSNGASSALASILTTWLHAQKNKIFRHWGGEVSKDQDMGVSSPTWSPKMLEVWPDNYRET